jgi:hypothetical protein
MRIALDLNVLLDVAQNRPAFYQDSEEVLARAKANMKRSSPRTSSRLFTT